MKRFYPLFVFPVTSRMKRRDRRSYRLHAKNLRLAGLPEKALIWLKRARNG